MLNQLFLTTINIKAPAFENANDLYVTATKNYQFGFQNPNSKLMEAIISFHDDLMVFLTFILFFVIYILYYVFNTFSESASNSRSKIKTPEFGGFVHHPNLEIIWTIIPALILAAVVYPSFTLLYTVDEIVEPTFTFKTVGHQWYWSYEIMAGNEFSETVLGDTTYPTIDTTFDSYMLQDDDLDSKQHHHLRLLAVDKYIALPTEQNVRVLVTAADVIHSWAVPSLGVKLDACPGRLNQTALNILRPGFYYGQCSELCGVNHGFMPIGILALDIPGQQIPKVLAEALFLMSTQDEA